MEAKIGVAFIGSGRVAENHYNAVKRCEAACLVGIYDVDAKQAAKCAKDWNTKRYTSVEEIYTDPSVQAVFVLTPVEYHHRYTIQALQAGKEVLVEKPVSFELAEIDEMIEVAQKLDRVCIPGHSYLYLPHMTRTRRLISEGNLGQLCHMEMKEIYRMPDEYAKKYHGVLGEVFCHPIYTMLYMFGSPKKVSAFSTCFRKEAIASGDEQVVALFQFASGATAVLMHSWALEDETSDPWTFKIKVLGTDGGTSFSRKDAVTGIINNQPPWTYPMYDESFELEVDYFINRCIKRKQAPLSTLEDARKTLVILNAIKKAISKGTVEEIG